MSTVGTIAVGQILPDFTPTRDRGYIGRHRIPPNPVIVRAARRIAHEWNKPRAWTTAAGEAIANRLNDDQAERMYDFLTGETFRDVSGHIARTWRNLDQAAYGRLPKTWRHRLEARHRARQALDDSRNDTEQWWAQRKDDYAPALGIHTPTQSLKVIEEKSTV